MNLILSGSQQYDVPAMIPYVFVSCYNNLILITENIYSKLGYAKVYSTVRGATFSPLTWDQGSLSPGLRPLFHRIYIYIIFTSCSNAN